MSSRYCAPRKAVFPLPLLLALLLSVPRTQAFAPFDVAQAERNIDVAGKALVGSSGAGLAEAQARYDAAFKLHDELEAILTSTPPRPEPNRAGTSAGTRGFQEGRAGEEGRSADDSYRTTSGTLAASAETRR